LLSDLTGIPLALSLNQISTRVEEYMRLMGEDCRMATYRGIDAKTLYRNIHVVLDG